MVHTGFLYAFVNVKFSAYTLKCIMMQFHCDFIAGMDLDWVVQFGKPSDSVGKLREFS